MLLMIIAISPIVKTNKNQDIKNTLNCLLLSIPSSILLLCLTSLTILAVIKNLKTDE